MCSLKNALEFKSVSKVFNAGDHRKTHIALEDIELVCPQGKISCILGPSGCGKTTLLRLAASLDRPTEGAIEIAAGKSVAMVTQGDDLLPWLRVLDNVSFGPELQGVNKRDRRKLAMSALARVGLDKRAARSYPHELSGGMRQRASLARVLCADADILLLDEPMANIDEPTRHELQQLLCDLAADGELTIVFVTHNIEEAVFLADHLVVMTHAKIAAKMEVKLNRPRNRYSDDFIKVNCAIRQLMT